jgi:hypothetical protein
MSKKNFNGYEYENISIRTLSYPLTGQWIGLRVTELVVGPNQKAEND